MSAQFFNRSLHNCSGLDWQVARAVHSCAIALQHLLNVGQAQTRFRLHTGPERALVPTRR